MEAFGYRDVLEDILRYTEGRHTLTTQEVCIYVGLGDPRTARKRYPHFDHGRIAAPVLARLLCGGTK